MERKIVAANLKMNLTYNEISNYVKELDNINSNKDLIICPSYIYLPYFVNKSFSVGSQNAYFEDKGAFTGEVSSKQLKSMNVEYTILGHSERRQIFKEENTTVNKKVISALNNELNVILCIGETKEEKNLLKTNEVLKNQIVNCFKDISFEKAKNVIIAYEPIWSIGTGVIPTNKEIENTTIYIKEIFKELYENNDVKVLYGGSVNEKNIELINSISQLSGVLVGGASLDVCKLNKIKEVVLN